MVDYSNDKDLQARYCSYQCLADAARTKGVVSHCEHVSQPYAGPDARIMGNATFRDNGYTVL